MGGEEGRGHIVAAARLQIVSYRMREALLKAC